LYACEQLRQHNVHNTGFSKRGYKADGKKPAQWELLSANFVDREQIKCV
jgi:hypothetical protein